MLIGDIQVGNGKASAIHLEDAVSRLDGKSATLAGGNAGYRHAQSGATVIEVVDCDVDAVGFDVLHIQPIEWRMTGKSIDGVRIGEAD